MDFAISPEQEQLVAGLRDWLIDTLSHERIAALADGDEGWDIATWKQVVEFGLLDDADLSTVDVTLIAEQLGYGLYAGPYLSSLLALPLLPSDLASQVRAGALRASVAWSADPAHLRIDDSGRLTGEVRHINDLPHVDVVVIPLDSHRFATVTLGAEGIEAIARDTTDRTRRRGDLMLDDVEITISELNEADADRARQRRLVLLSAESVGAAQKALELAKDYVTDRQQFGKSIATYQAVGHRVADIYTRTQLSRSLVYWAAVAIDADSIDAEDATHAAKAFATESAVLSIEQAIQAHGGIGFTWDHVLHRYYKRARANAASGGSAQEHRAELANAIFA